MKAPFCGGREDSRVQAPRSHQCQWTKSPLNWLIWFACRAAACPLPSSPAWGAQAPHAPPFPVLCFSKCLSPPVYHFSLPSLSCHAGKWCFFVRYVLNLASVFTSVGSRHKLPLRLSLVCVCVCVSRCGGPLCGLHVSADHSTRLYMLPYLHSCVCICVYVSVIKFQSLSVSFMWKHALPMFKQSAISLSGSQLPSAQQPLPHLFQKGFVIQLVKP